MFLETDFLFFRKYFKLLTIRFLMAKKLYNSRGMELPLSFIDKSGNVVRPTRDNPFPDSSYSGKYTGRKKHYDSDRAYGSDNQYGHKHEHHDYSASNGLSGMLSIVGIFVGIFFLSNSITGNVIGLSNTTSSWIGGVLILIGLISLGFWIKNKKNK